MSTAANSAVAAAAISAAAEPDTKTVTVSLPSHVHAFFTREAAAEDRTLNNLLKRKLVALHDEAQADV